MKGWQCHFLFLVIPVASLIQNQSNSIGSFALTSGGPSSSLANFVTSLCGAPTASSQGAAINSSQHQVTPPPPPRIPFDTTLFTAAGSPLNIVAQTPPPPQSQTSQLRTQAQSINSGTLTPVAVISALPRSNSASPLVPPQPLHESVSCTSLDGGAATDTDTSVVAGEDVGGRGGEEGTPSKIEDGASPMSTAGTRKSATGKTSRRSGGSGLGTRPHRQNFTALQNRILTDWYNSHHFKPYPSTEDTKMLAQKSELTYSQVNRILLLLLLLYLMPCTTTTYLLELTYDVKTDY